jgi:hypothetical protein
VLAYAWDLCEIRDHSFLAAPPRPYMGGEVSGSGPSRLQVYANPNYRGNLETIAIGWVNEGARRW